jgi:hypothetical protein
MKTNKMKLVIGVIVVITAIVGAKPAHDRLTGLTVKLPKYPPIERAVWLEQNWSQEERDWFHHADQGTQTFDIPYEWFVALEQPELSFRAPGLLSDPTYLDRYGFISDDSKPGKPQLPVGFAHGSPMLDGNGSPWRNPRSNVEMTTVGFTCAACHTGRLTFLKTSVLVDGAPALTNLDKFRTGVALSLLYTRRVPFRFDRFAGRVLGPGANDKAKSALRKQLDQVLAQVETVHHLDEKVKKHSLEEGYGRLDALNRIGNAVFAVDLNSFDNYVSISAPVHYPRIWDASWFDWVQYNGSIEQPMVRNVGEALGVLATVKLIGGTADLFSSGVRVKTLFELEQLLAGGQPDPVRGFRGLNSPKWPTGILPPVNNVLATMGAGLYRELCQSCHLPPVTNAAFWASDRWMPPNSAGERYLDLEQIPIKQVGTDPAQAEDMKNRHVVIPVSLGITTNEFGGALSQIVEMTAKRWYDSQQPPASEELRQQMNGHRGNGIRAELAYKARPLNGIWATPPYLHNGSVPSLYALLSPVDERPRRFYLGNREYDPMNVGYVTDEFPGGFEFDTRVRGNSNGGHEFADRPKKDGVVGRWLSPDERRALTEYLKTM